MKFILLLCSRKKVRVVQFGQFLNHRCTVSVFVPGEIIQDKKPTLDKLMFSTIF